MQLQISTDYAIRIIHCLANHPDDLPTAMTIAEQMGITYPFFIKVANRLKHSGFICAVQGRNGGYYLGRPCDKISLYDIISAMEGDITINRCLHEDCYCSRGAVKECLVHDVLLDIQNELINRLSGVYVSELKWKNNSAAQL